MQRSSPTGASALGRSVGGQSGGDHPQAISLGRRAWLGVVILGAVMLAIYLLARPLSESEKRDRRLAAVEKALDAGREALAKDPDAAMAHFETTRDLAAALREDLERALSRVREASVDQPAAKKKLDESRRNLRNMLNRVRFRLSEAYENLATIQYWRLIQANQAAIAASYGPDARPFAPSNEAIAPILERIEKGLEADDRNARLYFLAAKVRRFVGQYHKALEAVEDAIRLDDRFAEAYVEKGLILASGPWIRGTDADRYRAEAMAAFRSALLLEEDLADAHYNLGLLLAIPPAGQSVRTESPETRRKAMRHLRRYLDLAEGFQPGEPVARRYLEALEQEEAARTP